MRTQIAVTVALCTVLQAPISVQERTSRASASVLSEHHLEALKSMAPQQQAELLLERAINRYRGANEEIVARARIVARAHQVDAQARIAVHDGDQLRRHARARGGHRAGRRPCAAWRGAPTTIDRLEPIARTGAQGCGQSTLGSRVARESRESNRSGRTRSSWDRHDPNENIRYWAVGGLAYLGTDPDDPGAARDLPRRSVADNSPEARRRAAWRSRAC